MFIEFHPIFTKTKMTPLHVHITKQTFTIVLSFVDLYFKLA